MTRHPCLSAHRHWRYAVCALLVPLFLSALPAPAARAADELVLAVQPILDPEQTRKAYQPLCDYLARASGRRCTLLTATHFYPYWETVRRGTGFNLALDAAHFTDYRAQKLGFEVLAKIPGTVSYTLITRDNELVLDVGELVGKRVVTLGIPSIGAARLNSLFPNPVRQPFTVEVTDAEQGMKLLLDGRASAAILPTPIVSQHMMRGAPVSVVLTTDPVPHIALSAAPSLDPALRQLLRQALLDAHNTAEGKKMLEQIGFERFEPADARLYRGQGQILKEYWGY